MSAVGDSPVKKESSERPANFVPRRRASVSAETSSVTMGKIVQKVVHEKAADAKERIKLAMQKCILFDGLDNEQESDIIDAMFEKKVDKDEMIIKEGHEGDNFYIIEKGEFVALKADQEVFSYDNKGSFGELALMYNCPRAATVIARSEGTLWCVDRLSFRNIIVVSTAKKRLQYERTLSEIELFQVLTPEDRSVIADCLTLEMYDPGEFILKEGDELTSDSKFYIVEKGEIECFKKIGDERKMVKTITTGGYFGEMALIEEKPRAADCVAGSKVKVLSMARTAFERIMGSAEEILGERIAEYKKINADSI